MTADTPRSPASPIEFYFDFLSPFGHFASLRIDELAARHGRSVDWRPMLLGISVLKGMHAQPILGTPLKGDDIRREALRYMRLHHLSVRRALVMPTMNPLPAARLFAGLRVHAANHAKPFARAAYAAYWQGKIDICKPETLTPVAAAAGMPEPLLRQALADPGAAPLLRKQVDEALAHGVFRSPFFIVDDEPFLGCDKPALIDTWLAEGGW